MSRAVEIVEWRHSPEVLLARAVVQVGEARVTLSVAGCRVTVTMEDRSGHPLVGVPLRQVELFGENSHCGIAVDRQPGA
jgi:hypothetical protein